MSEHPKLCNRAPQTCAQFRVLDSHPITPHKNPNSLKVTITAPRMRPSISNPVLFVSLSLIGHLGRPMSLLICQGWGQACGLSSKIPPASWVNLVSSSSPPPSPLLLAPLLSTRSRPGTHYVVYADRKLVVTLLFQLPALQSQVCFIKPGDTEGGVCALLWTPESVWPQWTSP